MRKLTILIAMTLVAATFSGCAKDEEIGSMAPADEPQPTYVLMAERETPIQDLPVPINFTQDEGKSRDYAAGNARYIDHTYYGAADKNAVASFYRLEMARNGWQRVHDRFNAGVRTIDFEKGTERGVVTISSRFNLFRPTVVQVEMWTTGRLPAPPGAGQ